MVTTVGEWVQWHVSAECDCLLDITQKHFIDCLYSSLNRGEPEIWKLEIGSGCGIGCIKTITRHLDLARHCDKDSGNSLAHSCHNELMIYVYG